MGQDLSSHLFPGYNDRGGARMIRGTAIANFGVGDQFFTIEGVLAIFGTAPAPSASATLTVRNLYHKAGLQDDLVLAVYSPADSWWEVIVVES